MGEWRYNSTILDVGTLYTREIAAGTQWVGGWLDPRAGLDAIKKTKILLLPGIEPRQSPQLVAIPTELS
jgi:hypothetical protein